MAETIERIYKLTVDGTAAVRQLDKIAENSDKITNRFDKLAAGAIKVGTALAGAFAAQQVLGAVQRNIDSMDELSKAVSKVGIAAEDLQRLRYAADLSGVSAEQLDKAIGRLATGMSELKDGTSDTSQALRQLGAQTGENTIDTLKRISDQFQKMPDGIQKTALAIDLFGKSAGPDMIPLLNAGGEALQALADEADRFGGVLSGGTLQAAEAFNDNLSRMSRVASGIGAQITAGLLPALVAITDDLTDAAKAGDGFVDTGQAIGEMLAELYGFGLKASATLQAFGLVLKSLADAATSPTQATTILGKMIDDVNAIEASTNDRLAKLAENLNKVNESTKTAGDRPPIGGNIDLPKIEKAAKAIDEVALAEQRRMLGAKILIEIEQAEAQVLADLADQTARYAKEAEDAAKAQADLIRSLDPAGAAAADYAEKLAQIDELYFSGAVNAEQFERMQAQLNGTFGKTGETMAKQKDEIDILTDGYEGFFDNLANGAADAEEVFKRMVQSIIAELLKLWARKYIVEAIFGVASGGGGGAAAAQGLAFEAGEVQPFARGGVISRPLMMPMALMGEAGPEAIMPLKRTASGDLGVQAQAAPMNVTVNNYSDATVTTRRNGPNDLEIIVEQTRAAIAADLRSGGNPVSRSLEQAYGIGRGSAAAF